MRDRLSSPSCDDIDAEHDHQSADDARHVDGVSEEDDATNQHQNVGQADERVGEAKLKAAQCHHPGDSGKERCRDARNDPAVHKQRTDKLKFPLGLSWERSRQAHLPAHDELAIHGERDRHHDVNILHFDPNLTAGRRRRKFAIAAGRLRPCPLPDTRRAGGMNPVSDVLSMSTLGAAGSGAMTLKRLSAISLIGRRWKAVAMYGRGIMKS
jgi:hypothetical protein